MPVLVSPVDALVSQPRTIIASGLVQGTARVLASMEKADGSFWCSTAIFEIGAHGELDFSRDVPTSGNWDKADAMAPIWSMRKIRDASFPEKSADIDPLTVTISITDAAGKKHRTSMVQRFLEKGVTYKDIDEPGLSGRVFFPAGKGPHPVVLGLNGSNGGMPLQRSALYAANGYIAVALAYFGAPGRPKYFGETHLEYFEQALQWIIKSLQPKDDFIIVSGASRGGELALLLSSLYPQYIKGCIGFVPSSVINGIQQAGEPGRSRDEPAWYLHGKPLANLWKDNPCADVSIYTTPETPGVPIRQADGYLKPLSNKEFLEKSSIPVEKIQGPVLLISGEDDGSWPSALFSRMVEDRLRKHHHPWLVEHITNPKAGHKIGFPYAPDGDVVATHPVSGLVMDHGGTPEVNSQACVKSWKRVLEFMHEAPQLYATPQKK